MQRGNFIVCKNMDRRLRLEVNEKTPSDAGLVADVVAARKPGTFLLISHYFHELKLALSLKTGQKKRQSTTFLTFLFFRIRSSAINDEVSFCEGRPIMDLTDKS